MRRALVVAGLLAVAPACGDGGGDPVAQPAPDVTTFESGSFAGIPLPPLAEEAGARADEDGVVTQSFFVRNRAPEDVLAFYERSFLDDGVEVITPPRNVGGVTWRGWWLLEDGELLISALPAPTTGGVETEGADVVTQLNLELWPPGSAQEHDPVDATSSR